jgi:hypothetical protein
MATKKLQPIESITGMWNGKVVFKFLGCQTEERLHIGLADAEKIQSGASAESVVLDVIKKHMGYSNIQLIGLKPDRKAEQNVSPFA